MRSRRTPIVAGLGGAGSEDAAAADTAEEGPEAAEDDRGGAPDVAAGADVEFGGAFCGVVSDSESESLSELELELPELSESLELDNRILGYA